MDEQTLTRRLVGDLGRRELTTEGQGLTLGVELAVSGRLVGDVVLFFRSARHAGGGIGYVFHPDIAGHGYATEACAAVLDLAFDKTDGLWLHRIVARMERPQQRRSVLGVPARNGSEAHHRRGEVFNSAWADIVVYAILDHEWARAPRSEHASRRLVSAIGGQGRDGVPVD